MIKTFFGLLMIASGLMNCQSPIVETHKDIKAWGGWPECPASRRIPCDSAIATITTDVTIKRLAETGEICRVLKHRWAKKEIDTLSFFPEGAPEYRECLICRRVEMQEWVEVKAK